MAYPGRAAFGWRVRPLSTRGALRYRGPAIRGVADPDAVRRDHVIVWQVRGPREVAR
jgi:hypothetical protein